MRRRRKEKEQYAAGGSPSPSPSPDGARTTTHMSSAEMLRRIREEQERKAAELEQRDAILGVQAMAENELAYTKLVSNLAQLDHQTRMSIINNIK